jgi:hypothetical protein
MRTRVAALSVFCLSVVLGAAPASAQYRPRGTTSDRATGETYHVEVTGDLWNPTPEITIKSESLGIPGDPIDFVADLGIVQKKFRQLKVVLRPSKKTKLRFEYTPITYDATGIIRRNIVFNGILFPVALPVQTNLQWKAYRFGYEYDMVYTNRGFFGVLLEAKYTDVQASLQNILGVEFAQARAPIPSIGAIARVYVVSNISITGELSGFPEGIVSKIDSKSEGHYFDLDIYGTVNFTDHAGAQAGYRSFNVFYQVDDNNSGNLKLKGLYFGGVLRF